MQTPHPYGASLAPMLHCSPKGPLFFSLTIWQSAFVFPLAATLQCTHQPNIHNAARPGARRPPAAEGGNAGRSLSDADAQRWEGACEAGPRLFSQLNIRLFFNGVAPCSCGLNINTFLVLQYPGSVLACGFHCGIYLFPSFCLVGSG